MVEPPRDADEALQVTLRLGGRPVAHRVVEPGEALFPDTPVALTSTRHDRRFVVRGPNGEADVVGPEARTAVRAGAFEVDLDVVPRFRLPRFSFDQGDVALPILMVSVGLFVTQLMVLSLVWNALFTSGDRGGFEPTPEYLARLLRGDTDGSEQGVVSLEQAPRPKGEAIESYYLPAGSPGPVTEMRGGAEVGPERRVGSPRRQSAKLAAPALGPGGELEVVTPAADAGEDGSADADLDSEEEKTDDQPVAVEVTEGWGLSDWYDTEDAREDARDIEQQLRVARQVLKLDPENPQALMVRSYYEYLAMDYPSAQKTYETFTHLYPEEAAGWNNLALTYKRTGEYQKEEELYRLALELAPDDDHALVNLALCLGHQGRFDEAWAIMDKLDRLNPGDPYADLHRAKIAAAQGKKDQAYRYLQKSLAAMRRLDTLHNIEFRQDIRVDPALEELRGEERFRRMLLRYYGDQPEGWWQRLKP